MNKIVFLILSLLLIIVLLKPLLGENFQIGQLDRQNYCVFDINDKRYGKSGKHKDMNECVKSCMASFNGNCSYSECHNSCLKCSSFSNVPGEEDVFPKLSDDEKQDICPWYTIYNKESTYLDKIELVVDAGDGNCLIRWKAPRPDVKSYYIFVDELYDQKSSTQVKVLQSKCTDCSYVYENLNNGSTYTIIMKCLLKNGEYLESEKVTVTIMGESFESKHDQLKQMSG